MIRNVSVFIRQSSGFNDDTDIDISYYTYEVAQVTLVPF
jgi:hypothetical protein